MATILNTDDIPLLAGCTRATLSLASDTAGTLMLSFADQAPEWAEYKASVHLYHLGKLLFAGKVTECSHSNAGGEKGAEVVVTDWRWLYENKTFAAILAEEQESLGQGSSGGGGGLVLWAGGSAPTVGWLGGRAFGSAATAAARSWHSLAAHCAISAPGWAAQSDVLTIDPSLSTLCFSARDYSKSNRPISAWTVIADMRASNPDCSFRPNYATGALQVISYSLAEHITWSADEMIIQGLESITPMHDRKIDGVAVFVSYPHGTNGAERLIKRTYPAAIDALATQVVTFTSSADKASRAGLQATHLLRQAIKYYDAVNTLVYSGSVTVRAAQVAESMVARRLSVTGEGTRPEWHTMGTIVTAEEWDFLVGTLTLTLGREFADPTLHELSWAPEAEGDGGGDGGDDGGGDGGDDDKEEELYDLVARFEEGTPTPDGQSAEVYTYPLKLYCDDAGRDVSTVVTYTLSITSGLEEHPELDDSYLVTPPDRTVDLRLVRGKSHMVELAASWDSRGRTTDPDNPYQAVLRWPDTDEERLEVELSQATVVGGNKLTVQATVRKNGAPYDKVHYIWTVSEPAVIPTGYKPSAELQADYMVEAGDEDARREVSYTLTVIDREGAASGYASGVYTPEGVEQKGYTLKIISAHAQPLSKKWTYRLTAEARVYYDGKDVTNEFSLTWYSSFCPDWFCDVGDHSYMLDKEVTLPWCDTGTHPLLPITITLEAWAYGESKDLKGSVQVEFAAGSSGSDPADITDAQKRYNLFLYLGVFGNDFGYTSYPYLNPSVFPDWIWGMSEAEMHARLLAESERK